jgi:hypothetical protein
MFNLNYFLVEMNLPDLNYDQFNELNFELKDKFKDLNDIDMTIRNRIKENSIRDLCDDCLSDINIMTKKFNLIYDSVKQTISFSLNK